MHSPSQVPSSSNQGPLTFPARVSRSILVAHRVARSGRGSRPTSSGSIVLIRRRLLLLCSDAFLTRSLISFAHSLACLADDFSSTGVVR